MNIDELREERLEMERRIRAFISQQINDFQDDSGTKVSVISIELADYQVVGEKSRRSLVNSVDVGIDI